MKREEPVMVSCEERELSNVVPPVLHNIKKLEKIDNKEALPRKAAWLLFQNLYPKLGNRGKCNLEGDIDNKI